MSRFLLQVCYERYVVRHGIYYCETFTRSKLDVKYGNTVKLTT